MTLYDEEAEMLNINNEPLATEFQIATHQALVNNEPEFEFHGYIVLTRKAVDAVQSICKSRTYH